jgi:hypothetical protein
VDGVGYAFRPLGSDLRPGYESAYTMYFGSDEGLETPQLGSGSDKVYDLRS